MVYLKIGIRDPVEDMLYSIDNLISLIRFLVGIILTIVGLRAFLGTRNPAMLYLTAGFALITVGNLFSSLYYVEDLRMDRLLSNVFDIIGLIALLIAIKKS
jgi:hypothetical protein